MIIYDQFRISDDGKKMFINLHVNTASYYDDIYLDSITIMTADKVSESNPYAPTSDYVYQTVLEGEQKECDLVLVPTDFNELFLKNNFSQDLFFVYVKVKGTPDPCTPCGMDDEVTVNVLFDETLFYQKVMQFTKELANECQVPAGFMDFIMLWNALNASIRTGHFVPAINYWNIMFGKSTNINTLKISKPCGCHG